MCWRSVHTYEHQRSGVLWIRMVPHHLLIREDLAVCQFLGEAAIMCIAGGGVCLKGCVTYCRL